MRHLGFKIFVGLLFQLINKPLALGLRNVLRGQHAVNEHSQFGIVKLPAGKIIAVIHIYIVAKVDKVKNIRLYRPSVTHNPVFCFQKSHYLLLCKMMIHIRMFFQHPQYHKYEKFLPIVAIHSCSS